MVAYFFAQLPHSYIDFFNYVWYNRKEASVRGGDKMLQKVAFNAIGHSLTAEDCAQISELIADKYNLSLKNDKLTKRVSELEQKLKTKVFQLDPQTVIIIAPDDCKIVQIRGDTVEIRRLEEP